MLEMPRRSGSKIMSHMLTSHGGEIFIHTLNIARSVLEDPPSISEGTYACKLWFFFVTEVSSGSSITNNAKKVEYIISLNNFVAQFKPSLDIFFLVK